MATEPAKTGDDDKAFAKFSDTLSKVISAIDGLCSRMDELDAKAEKSRKDSEDAAGEREKQMKDELEALKSHTNMQPEERSGFGEAQARANSVYRLNGKQAPPVMAGEKLFDYRRRLLAPLLKELRAVREDQSSRDEPRHFGRDRTGCAGRRRRRRAGRFKDSWRPDAQDRAPRRDRPHDHRMARQLDGVSAGSADLAAPRAARAYGWKNLKCESAGF